MEHKGHGLGSVALVVAVIAVFIALNASQTKSIMMSNEDNNFVTVDGTAERYVTPDTAKVSFGITRKTATTREASDSVNARMAELTKLLADNGVAAKDIKTTTYNISPQYIYNNGARTFDGYRVTQRVEVVIRDVDMASDVLSVVNGAGVDDVSGLTFYVDDDEAIKEELRAEAIANAKDKAKQLEKDLGVSFRGIVGFYESSALPVALRTYSAMDAGMGGSAPEAAVVPTGENHLTANVSITYRIN